MTMPDDGGAHAAELRVARALAREAAELVMQLRGGDASLLAVEMKPGDEPVTVADRAASDLIVTGLLAAFPDDVVISEERADEPARLTARRCWYVDPIDGTKDFIRGREGFAVMIGLCVDGVPVVGVVHQPTTHRAFWAADGAAFTADGDGPPHPLAVSAVQEARAIRLVASKSHRSDAIDQVKALLGVTDELNIGSVGLKLCLIAAGERDLYVNPWPKCKAWDTCAPEAILVAAGGVLTDTRGAALRYDDAELGRLGGLIASNRHVHADVVARLASLFPRSP